MILRKTYLQLFIFVYAMYLFFNRGVAYSFMAEITWALGLILLVRERKNYEFLWNKRTKILVVLLVLTPLYMIRGFMKFSIMDVVRDSFMINYCWFIPIIFLFREELEDLKINIFRLYNLFPFVILAAFLLRTNIVFFEKLSLFGGIPLLEYKNGDLAVQLLITVLLILNKQIVYKPRVLVLALVAIAYLFLIVATFNRGGALAFTAGFFFFFYTIRKTVLGKQMLGYIKYVPVFLLIAIPLYTITKVEDKAQGRNVGITQLKDNVTSIFAQDKISDGGLSGNVAWRLAWWGKIVDYTIISGEYRWIGKGLGINLATDDDIPMEDDSLRAPHNFHLNILARFGLPFFLLWMYWLWLVMVKEFRSDNLSNEKLLLLSVVAAFLINAAFDVALEGPMAAFPCWVLLGISFVNDSKKGYSGEE